MLSNVTPWLAVRDEGAVPRVMHDDPAHDRAAAAVAGVMEVQRVASDHRRLGIARVERSHVADLDVRERLRRARVQEHVRAAMRRAFDDDAAREHEHLGRPAAADLRMVVLERHGERDGAPLDARDLRFVEGRPEPGVRGRPGRRDHDRIARLPARRDRRRSGSTSRHASTPPASRVHDRFSRAREIQPPLPHHPQPDVGRERGHPAADERRLVHTVERIVWVTPAFGRLTSVPSTTTFCGERQRDGRRGIETKGRTGMNARAGERTIRRKGGVPRDVQICPFALDAAAPIRERRQRAPSEPAAAYR